MALRPRILECHGGPWDGEWKPLPEPFTAMETVRRPRPGAVIVDPNLSPSVPRQRIGVYVVAKYVPPGGSRAELVLKWKGEEIRNG